MAAGQLEEGRLGALLPPLDVENRQAIRVWNRLGGALDWTGLPVAAALEGVQDLQDLIDRLTLIRDELRKRE